MAERERFFELLPFLVNGTLAAVDAAWMQAQLAQHPEWRSQLHFHEELQGRVRESVDASLLGVAADIGYADVAARIARERVASKQPKPRWQRAAGWIGGHSPAGGWRLAQGLAMGMMLGVGVMLAVQQERLEPARERSTMRGVADGPLLRASFQPQATENDLRLALVEARVLIVAGPTRLGDYYLKAMPGRLAAARDTLLRSGVAQQVDEVPGLPEDLLE